MGLLEQEGSYATDTTEEIPLGQNKVRDRTKHISGKGRLEKHRNQKITTDGEQF